MLHKLTAVSLAAITTCTFAAYNVGDKPRNFCWKDIKEKTICLDDSPQKDQVRVLLFNAGWCPPCNEEFKTIVRETNQFKGKAVTFISLSAEGWNHGTRADTRFLSEWSKRFNLDKAQARFVVASSPRNVGSDFCAKRDTPNTAIPNVAIIDISGELVYSAVAAPVSQIVREVKKRLPKPVPGPRTSKR